jgi:hypothetical protein
MSKEQQSGLSEAIDAGKKTVDTLNKIKTLSAATKGMAKGGVAGAAIETALYHRKTIAKIIIVAIALFMIPVMFILMLPSLIFGGLTSNTGSLNNYSSMSGNLSIANQAIISVLQETHSNTIADINAEIQQLPSGDTASINDPFAYSIAVNANLLISQYCSSKGNWKEISIDDLTKTIRENASSLFSYTKTTQTSTIEVDVETTDEDGETIITTQTITITQHIYSVSYVGDSYFADNIFKLNDTQKELANNFSENLSLFFGQSADGYATANVSDAVLKYRPDVERIAAQYGMSQYVELLLAVMMQESGGRVPDVMQASEGGFNTKYPRRPNAITDPLYSIECGVQELKFALEKAGVTGPTDLDRIKLALQGYNCAKRS